jgi:hypothetical protein
MTDVPISIANTAGGGVGHADGGTDGIDDVGANEDDGNAVGERLGGQARLVHNLPKNLAGS